MPKEWIESLCKKMAKKLDKLQFLGMATGYKKECSNPKWNSGENKPTLYEEDFGIL